MELGRFVDEVGTAQLVEHPTEKPGAVLTWCGNGFFSDTSLSPGMEMDFSLTGFSPGCGNGFFSHTGLSPSVEMDFSLRF